MIECDDKYDCTYLYQSSNTYIISLPTYFIEKPNIYQFNNIYIAINTPGILGR